MENWMTTRFTPVLTASGTSPTYTANTDLITNGVVPETFGLWWPKTGPEIGVVWRLKMATVSNVGSGIYYFNLPVPPLMAPQWVGTGHIVNITDSPSALRAVVNAYVDPAFSLTHAVVFVDPAPEAAARGDFVSGTAYASASNPYELGALDIILFTGSYLRA